MFIELSVLCFSILWSMASSFTRRWRNIAGNAGDFGSGGGKPKVQTISDTYGDTLGKLLQYLSSEQERASLGKVDEYAKTGYGETFKAGQKQIQETLGGGDDPSTSPYYQAVKAQSAWR